MPLSTIGGSGEITGGGCHCSVLAGVCIGCRIELNLVDLGVMKIEAINHLKGKSA